MNFIDCLDELNKSVEALNDNVLKVTQKIKAAKMMGLIIMMGLTMEELEADLEAVGKIKPSAEEEFKEPEDA